MTTPALDHPDVRSALDLLAAWTESQVAYRPWPGLSIAVVHDGSVWARGFGFADTGARTPAGPQTLYRVASITKTFTATAILQLRDAGALRLDDPVAEHLPWFTPPSAHRGAPPITIRHLLTHTAGVAREAPFPYWMDGNFPTVDAIRAAVATQACVLPTETRWKYSNLAFVVAGEVVAARAGMPWADYVRRRILEPLGMRDTLVDGLPRDSRLARPYARRLPDGTRDDAPASDLRGIAAAATLTTTATDLARYVTFQLADAGDDDVLKVTTRREMHRVHWLEPEWQAGWSLGFHVIRLRNRTLVGHGGSLRGYRSEIRFSPDDRLGVIVLINADDGEPRAIVDKAFEWVAPAVARVTAPPPPDPDPAWQRYVGRYRSPWGDTQVLVTGGRLTLIGPNLPDPMLAPATLVPTGEHTFRLETKDGFGSAGEPVVFELDASGRVTRVRVGAGWSVPVDAW